MAFHTLFLSIFLLINLVLFFVCCHFIFFLQEQSHKKEIFFAMEKTP